MPDSVKANYEEHDLITEELESPSWGSQKTWDDLASYGLFVFDWKLNNGLYVRESIPKKSINPELKSKILNITDIPKLSMGFGDLDKS